MQEKEFLFSYNADKYPRPSVAADIVIFTIADTKEENYRKLSQKELRVLLIKRGAHPFKDMWALPGGFSKPNENLSETACRELKEETGIEQAYLEQLYTFSKPDRDPRAWIMSCAYMALLDSKLLQVTAGDDAAAAEFFKVDFLQEGEVFVITLSNGSLNLELKLRVSLSGAPDEFEILSSGGLAFDHAKIIAYALLRLQNKIEYTDIAFKLVGREFTIGELQQVYEVILGKKLYAAAFRRQIADKIEEINQVSSGGGHRPPKLFRLKI